MLLALKFLKKLPLFFVVFFVYNCYYSEIFKNKIILNWEYSISRQEESIFQSLDKNFKIVPKDSNNPINLVAPQKKGYLWLKAKFLLPPELINKNVTFFINKFQWEKDLYLNGQLISSNIEYGSTHWNHRGINEIFTIPRKSINYDIENTLLVKLYFEEEIGFPTEMIVGEENSVFVSFLLENTKDKYYLYLIYILCFLFFLFHLRLFFIRNYETEHIYLFSTNFLFSFSAIYSITNFINLLGFKSNYYLINKLEFLFYFLSLFYLYKYISKRSKIATNEIEIYITEIYTIASIILFLFSGLNSDSLIPGSIRMFLPIPIYSIIILKVSKGSAKKIDFCRVVYPFILLLFFSVIFEIYNLFYRVSDFSYEFIPISLLIIVVSTHKILEISHKLNKIEKKNENLEFILKDKFNLLSIANIENNELQDNLNKEFYVASILTNPFQFLHEDFPYIKVNSYLEQKNNFLFNGKTHYIGGDICITKNLYDFENEINYLFFCNIDATGKSLKGSIGAISAGVFLKNELNKRFIDQPKTFLKKTLLQLNEIYKSFNGNMFLSVSIGLIDTSNGDMYHFTIGHPRNILLRDKKLEYLNESIHSLIGSFEEEIIINTFKLKNDDILYISSDGRESIELGGIYGGAKSDTEKLFFNLLEKSNGDLDFFIQEIKNFGRFSDDFSIIQIKCQKFEYTIPSLEIRDSFEDRVKADNYLYMKNYDSALKIYLSLVDEISGSDLFYKIGLCYKNLKLYEKSIEFFKISKEKNENNIINLLQLCDTYRIIGDEKEVSILFKYLEKNFPQVSQIVRINSYLN
jgi:hypothetical protein